MITGDTKTISGWYVVNGYYEFNSRLTVSGTANIVIVDGSTLYLKDGICVNSGNTLNIYGQRDGSGTLKCEADTNYNAAIGLDDEKGSCGTINIYGANVIADAASYGVDGAGIGGGNECGGGTVTIYGGSVTAKGATDSAGIGGGDEGNGGSVIIYDGTVNAYGGEDGAGIGGGDEGNGGSVTIYSGNVTANGGADSAGIGGGDKGSGGSITIYSGTVNATGGSYGAGIGGGDADGEGKNGGTITIYGGNVTAQGGIDGAGIGGGEGSAGGTITIYDGTINATGGSTEADGGAGIGSGDKDGKDINGGTIKIYGGNITANGGANAAGIGGGDDCNGGTIEISGGTVNATGRKGSANDGGSGIGGGDKGSGGIITISGGNVTANGGFYAAGIGGGHKAAGGTITITGGTVTARGGAKKWDAANQVGDEGGAGIGGGKDGVGGRITITGGEIIEAIGGSNRADQGGAGIGSGVCGTDGSLFEEIRIEGGRVIARGGGKSPGIGSAMAVGAFDFYVGPIFIGGDSSVEAYGGAGAPGIGAGDDTDGGTVTIQSGCKVTALGNNAAGIGGGPGKSNGNVVFNGDTAVWAGENEQSAAYVGMNAYISDHSKPYVRIEPFCTLSYNANWATGGTVPTGDVNYLPGENVVVSGNTGNLENTLHTFAGWNTKADGSGTTYQPGDIINMTSSVTLYAKWDAVSVPYMDWNGTALVEKSGGDACKVFRVVVPDTTAFENGMWYVADGSVSVENRISVKGTAHLILPDGAALNAKQGITLGEGSSLILHGQSGGTGALTALGNLNGAGIGGTDIVEAGTLIVNGVNVNATGGAGGAGIGGGRLSSGGTVTVNGGTVTANGGEGGAGIGGG